MNATRTARRAAPIALVVGLLLVAFVVVRGGASHGREVTGVFENVNGLVVGADVRVAGFAVGHISAISLPRDGYPHVSMQIGNSVHLRRGATADIRLTSQAGQLNRYIAITNGRGAPLPDRATLGLSRTDQPVEIDEFLSALTPKTRREVRTLLNNTVNTFHGHATDFHRALRYSANAWEQTAGLVGDISADRAALSQLVSRASLATSQLAHAPAGMQQTIDGLTTLLDTGARRRSEIDQTLRQLPDALHDTTRVLARVDRSIAPLHRVLDAAGPAVDALEPFAHVLRRTATVAPKGFAATRELLRAWITSSARIRKLMATATPVLRDLGIGIGQANPIFDHLRARAPDALGFIPLLGDATANYDATGHGARIMGMITEAPKRYVGADECRGGWLRRPFNRTPGALECEPWTDYFKSFVGGAKPDSAYITPAEQASHDGGMR